MNGELNYSFLLLVFIVVIVGSILVILCVTRINGDYSTDEYFSEEPFIETPTLLATLSEDARLSYEQAKSI